MSDARQTPGQRVDGSSRTDSTTQASPRMLGGTGGTRFFVKVLTVFGFALPVGAYFSLIQHFAVNAIWYDQWEDINVIAHPTLSNLWAQHNENRIFFPNLVTLVLAHTTHFNIHVEDYVSGVMLVAAVALIIAAHKRRSPSTPWLLYCPVAIIMLSFVQVGNALWGFQMAWYLVMLALALVLYLADRPVCHWWVLAGAITAAIVGSFSSLQGLLIWPGGLIVLCFRRRPAGMVLTWIASALAAGALYFYHYSSAARVPTATFQYVPGSYDSYVVTHPSAGIQFFLSTIGDIVGQPLPVVGRNDGILILGAVLVAAAIVAVLAYVFAGKKRGSPIGIALICFGLLFAATITAGRVAYGLYYADTSRYTTFDLLILVGCYLALLERRDAAKSGASRSWKATALVGVRVIVVAVTVLLIVLGTTNGLAQAGTWRQKLSEAALVTVNIDKAPDNVVQGVLYPQPSESAAVISGFIRPTAQRAKRLALSVFGSSDVREILQEGLPAGTHVVARVARPANNARLHGSVLLDSIASMDIGPVRVSVSKVEFEITGTGIKAVVLGPAVDTNFGWLDAWNSVGVPNGTYTVRSVAFNSSGHGTYSAGNVVTVDNP
jgi:hypothetical protein